MNTARQLEPVVAQRWVVLTALLATHLDWRQTYLALAAILAVVTIPLHCFGLRRPWPPRPPIEPGHIDADPRHVARSRPFVLLAVTASLATLATVAAALSFLTIPK